MIITTLEQLAALGEGTLVLANGYVWRKEGHALFSDGATQVWVNDFTGDMFEDVPLPAEVL